MILCMIGATELPLTSGVVLLIFGGKKLPELMKGMGKGVKSFKEGIAEPSQEEIDRRVEEEVQRRADERESGIHACNSDDIKDPVKDSGAENE